MAPTTGDERAPPAVGDVLFDAGQGTENQRRKASEVLEWGEAGEGLEYALNQAGIG